MAGIPHCRTMWYQETPGDVGKATVSLGKTGGADESSTGLIVRDRHRGAVGGLGGGIAIQIAAAGGIVADGMEGRVQLIDTVGDGVKELSKPQHVFNLRLWRIQVDTHVHIVPVKQHSKEATGDILDIGHVYAEVA